MVFLKVLLFSLLFKLDKFLSTGNGIENTSTAIGTKVVLNWYLRSFGSGNSVPVPSIIYSNLTTIISNH
ncbi:hypothetical protein Hanom_Chr17g01576611 [Helianthus anomalus]